MADENTENTEEVETTDAAPAEPEAPAGPDASLSPVQKRAWYRQRSGTTANASRTPEEKAEARAAERKAKAAARRRRRLQEREKKAAKLGAEAGTDRGTPKPEYEAGRKQVRQGIVVSAKGDKTLAVQIAHAKRHPKYKKIVRHTTKLYAHDEQNDAGVGDTVRIESSRPLSRTKRWTLAEIVERAK